MWMFGESSKGALVACKRRSPRPKIKKLGVQRAPKWVRVCCSFLSLGPQAPHEFWVQAKSPLENYKCPEYIGRVGGKVRGSSGLDSVRAFGVLAGGTSVIGCYRQLCARDDRRCARNVMWMGDGMFWAEDGWVCKWKFPWVKGKGCDVWMLFVKC